MLLFSKKKVTKGNKMTFLKENDGNNDFYRHPEYLKFKKYTENLMKRAEKSNKVTRNWERGREKMKLLALTYNVDYNPEPPFDRKPKTVWFKLDDGLLIGVSDKSGDHWIEDGKHVFSARWLDYMMYPVKDKDVNTNFLIALITEFEGELLHG